MRKVALAFSTKDRIELSRRSIEPLLGLKDVDIFWLDGSSTEEGREFPVAYTEKHPSIYVHDNVVGGPDTAVAYALTIMLKGDYTHVGLAENDVLLHPDFFGPTMALFDRGEAEGLPVGAVSPRCYEDRVLIQREGYAIAHNLGYGVQILTREAAQLSLANQRTGWTTDNRRVFMQVAGLDIGAWWAFRGGEHNLCSDWANDAMLASHGLASLALTPSPVEMIGQIPPLHEQGLKLVDRPVDWLRNDKAFKLLKENLAAIRNGSWSIPKHVFLRDSSGWTIYPHQIPMIGGWYEGDWRLKWTMGLGPFAWKSGERDHYIDKVINTPNPMLTVPVSGSCDLLVSGGLSGGRVQVEDLGSGYSCSPDLRPEGDRGEVLSVNVPASVSYRKVCLTALTPGVIFYGLRTREEQPVLPGVSFDHSTLPPI